MGVFDSERNNGYGKSLSYAAKTAISEHFGGGAFGSQRTLNQRVSGFIDHLKQNGVRSFDKVTLSDVNSYGQKLAEAVKSGMLSVATAQNKLSSMNVVLSKCNGSSVLRVSPSSVVGERSQIRTHAPSGLDRSNVSKAIEAMKSQGLNRAAAVADLARELGCRTREAATADLSRWSKEAVTGGKVNIIDGCKGGRDADRWINVTPKAAQAIANALAAKPDGSANLLAKNETYREFVDRELSRGRECLRDNGIDKYHDLRASYACERYEKITGSYAPCVSGDGVQCAKEIDSTARQIISNELGHEREGVCVSYIGGKS